MSCQASDWKNLFVVAHEAMNLAYGERKRRRPLLSSVARAILFLVRYSLGFSAGMPKIKASRPFYPRYLNYEGKADSALTLPDFQRSNPLHSRDGPGHGELGGGAVLLAAMGWGTLIKNYNTCGRSVKGLSGPSCFNLHSSLMINDMHYQRRAIK